MVALFVFGTLKAGCPLHEKGLLGADFLGRCKTVQPYPMMIAGPWFAPMMFDEPGSGYCVEGELYDVSESRLRLLDELESVPKPGNFRRTIEVESLESEEQREALVYMKGRELAVPVYSSYLKCYNDPRFVPPWQRGENSSHA